MILTPTRKVLKCGYISSNLKINVDRFRYKDLVGECFGKANNNFLKERLKNLANNFKGEIFLSYKHKDMEQTKGLKRGKTRLVQERKQAESYEQRLTDMDSTLKTVKPQVGEFDEELVRRLIRSSK